MNLIEMIKEEIDGTVLSSISQKAGVSEEEAKKGLSLAIPSVLGGILKNGEGNDGNFLNGLLNISGDANLADNSNMADGSQLLEKGSALANNLFGSNREVVTNEISNATGLDQGKSSGLLAMIVPTVTGLLSKLMTKHNWNFSDLIGRIGSSKDEIFSSLPAGLRNSLGLADIKTPEMPDGPEIPNIEVPPAAPIPPVVDEPIVSEPLNPQKVEREPVMEHKMEHNPPEPMVEREPIKQETVEPVPVESERIPPRAAIPPEAKSGGMLRWVLIIVLVILVLWWLL